MILRDLLFRYPTLSRVDEPIWSGYEVLRNTVRDKGTILSCGNGGSSADAEHIVGELAKGFRLRRPLDEGTASKLHDLTSSTGERVTDYLQGAIRAIPLASSGPLASAIGNDLGFEYVFAQQVLAYGNPGDSLIGITTSGNSPNIALAASLAIRLGLHVVGLTGRSGGRLSDIASVCIRVPEDETFAIQELHLPVYHALCSMLEADMFTAG